MNKIRYDSNAMKVMSLFYSVTKTELQDYFKNNEQYVFIVKKNQISKAIGKGGSNVKRLERMLKNKVRIIEFDDNKLKFIQNLIYPCKTKEIKEEDGTVIIVPIDLMTRGLLIGKAGQKLRNHESIIKRYFDIKELKVV